MSAATAAHCASASPAVNGHHWLLDLSDCQAPAHLLEDATALAPLLLQAACDAGMDVVGHVFHQFAPTGVTGAVILAESHLTVHTWPESKFVAIDVYVCDFNCANHTKGERLAQALTELFAASVCHRQAVSRASTPSTSS
jgi:S-adenosylmethionine decarboxylase